MGVPHLCNKACGRHNKPRGPEYRRDDTQAEGTYTDPSTGHNLPASRTRWYVYDGLGSVVAEVDPSGNVTSSGTFDVYGARRQGGTGTASSKQGFVGGLGHVTDAETGLVYMRARYYDPQMGRFVSEDPGAHGTNWYSYAADNPVNRVDYNGKYDVAEDTAAAMLGQIIEGFGIMWCAMGVLKAVKGATGLWAALGTALESMSLTADQGMIGLMGVGVSLAEGYAAAAEAGKDAISGVLQVILGYKMAEDGAILQSMGAEGFDVVREDLADIGKDLLKG